MGLSCLWTDFRNWRPLEYFWFLGLVGVTVLGSLTSDYVSALAAVFNVVCVLLVAKGRNSNYVWGAVGVILYGYVCWTSLYYANFYLNIAYYLPLQFYGYYEWRKHLHTRTEDVAVKRLSLRQWFAVVALLALGTTFCAKIWLSQVQDPAPWLDGFGAFASIVAMWLMVKRYSDQWLLWIAVDVVTLYMWVMSAIFDNGPKAMVVMWTAFTINAIYGACLWYFVREGK